jgi:vacuolar-type H+-ATPase subunit I/STV1
MSTSTDPCKELKAKLTEIEASLKRLDQERENIIDEIEDTYSAWQESQDERYQLPH